VTLSVSVKLTQILSSTWQVLYQFIQSGRPCDLWPPCWNFEFGGLTRSVWPCPNFSRLTAKMSPYWGKICDSECKTAQCVRGVQNCIYFKSAAGQRKNSVFSAFFVFLFDFGTLVCDHGHLWPFSGSAGPVTCDCWIEWIGTVTIQHYPSRSKAFRDECQMQYMDRQLTECFASLWFFGTGSTVEERTYW